MKKIMLFSLLIVLIPIIIVIFFKEKTEIKFESYNNMLIRIKQSDNSILVIPFEEYIVGVLAGEMSPQFDSEALKAQAVASRSYALIKMDENNNKDYDVTNDTTNQVYLDKNYLQNAWGKNYLKKINVLRDAVKKTAGEYLEYEGEIVYAFFFSTSSGYTENSEDVFNNALPYLRSVISSWDEEVSPMYTKTFTFTLSNFCKTLDLECSNGLKIEKKEITKSGMAKKIKLNGNIFESSQLRTKFKLLSSNFDIKVLNEEVVITTKGYGHNVGMSQYGALGMAQDGYKYDEILKHYYVGSKIKKI